MILNLTQCVTQGMSIMQSMVSDLIKAQNQMPLTLVTKIWNASGDNQPKLDLKWYIQNHWIDVMLISPINIIFITGYQSYDTLFNSAFLTYHAWVVSGCHQLGSVSNIACVRTEAARPPQATSLHSMSSWKVPKRSDFFKPNFVQRGNAFLA